MSSFDFLTIQTNKTPIAFMLSWHIAREHYVVARVSLQQGMTYPSCLLAQQSVEMFVKAILHLDHKSKVSHDLLELLKLGKEKVAYFDKLLTDPKLFYFIRNLAPVYFKMRFGEVGFTIKSDELVQVLDEVAFNLDKSYREIMKNEEKCPFYVPDAMKEAFLRDNEYFSEKDISNNFMATVPMP
jgi:HEPN domain-containing protein